MPKRYSCYIKSEDAQRYINRLIEKGMFSKWVSQKVKESLAGDGVYIYEKRALLQAQIKDLEREELKINDKRILLIEKIKCTINDTKVKDSNWEPTSEWINELFDSELISIGITPKDILDKMEGVK